MATGGVDAVTALLAAAANPKLRRLPSGNYSKDVFKAQDEFAAAARNGIRALCEEWLQRGVGHLRGCHRAVFDREDGICTCGRDDRRASLEAALAKMEKTKWATHTERKST